jgi:hypothetical protein
MPSASVRGTTGATIEHGEPYSDIKCWCCLTILKSHWKITLTKNGNTPTNEGPWSATPLRVQPKMHLLLWSGSNPRPPTSPNMFRSDQHLDQLEFMRYVPQAQSDPNQRQDRFTKESTTKLENWSIQLFPTLLCAWTRPKASYRSSGTIVGPCRY